MVLNFNLDPDKAGEMYSTIGLNAEAESLRLQRQVISPDLVKLRQIEAQMKAIEKWDGKLPNVTGRTVPFIQVEK